MMSRTTRSRKLQPGNQPGNQSRAKWTASLTKTFADLMVDQIHQGNKSNKSFSKKGWKFIRDNFRIQTGLWWDNDQLKSRYAALRKQYLNVKFLLDHGDFNWDETTGTITGSEEAWERCITDHPDADITRTGGCPIYNQLRIIFAETGTYQKNSKSTDGNDGIPGPFLSSPRHLRISMEELSQSESDKSVDPAMHKRGRKGTEDAIAKGILEMAAATKLRAETLKKYNERYPIADCVRALDELQGVLDDQIYFAALDLFDYRIARETFLSLKVEKRLVWLRGKCLASGPPSEFR